MPELPPRPEMPAAPRHVHLIAVAGVGMASLAGMFRAAGYEVTGSDQAVYPPMSDVLAQLGIPVREGYRAENLEPRPDVVVVGNAMSRGNPEVEALLASGIPYCSMPEALMRFFMRERRRAVVVGTHGKTTTSAMLAWVLHQAGGDPSFMVGGASRNFPRNFRLGAGPWFVAEGDEYDTAFFDKGPKFLHYDPDALLINAVEFDHADIYRDLEHVKGAFRTLLERLRPSAVVAASADFPEVRKVVAASGRSAIYFGREPGAIWQAEDVADDGGTTRFTIVGPGGSRVRVAMPLPGAINVANALGVAALADAMGVQLTDVAAALATFRGVKRRQEVIAEGRGITVIDDFAHHPTAVVGTLAALRARYPRRRFWVLFEPRSNTTRRRVFQEAFADAFANADRVTFGAIHRRDQLPEHERLSVEELIATLGARGVPAETCEDADAIAARVAAQAASGDVVVLMSNGGFGGLAGKLVSALGLPPAS
ncbi:MAG: UDP-N-acetylmuramate:L-alanyl-gamma-D-glutamyl-meso-diaminopimelate ligase [Polyangiaceae bacterium UTPRO1]|jgi:UDP-N-acetylmuramate: L-alanyl-gamma-D-glutamyl-meso-diaminopimelate ligase|nr:UDP-N-acetylmuramate:L-alanyl-gamma-D-glutamyl-meso-diaminopimelate ligase [Myxococcales bacterium]OQY64859.1 MAG: UDP-N-acetylmuramate:L-alanyl-gamma-D-glutamyl-meso-diaminopimelate ligase [Polyangiaceae bacterium UTPRO1]